MKRVACFFHLSASRLGKVCIASLWQVLVIKNVSSKFQNTQGALARIPKMAAACDLSRAYQPFFFCQVLLLLACLCVGGHCRVWILTWIRLFPAVYCFFSTRVMADKVFRPIATVWFGTFLGVGSSSGRWW